ncbi:iron complex transport system permease protein [Fontimonas thermophila]|uniref:Iron complex transport system permease protein n=1 Tax=Fontimonas thermophila TaxID=1076937 RepID=A0A1I2HSF8_9GAMM|nr:iron ABC transporter permease [Fontimonas thermophila]SFF32250.1 iron complex transport system permease protein [Fontimonas thermophila]
MSRGLIARGRVRLAAAVLAALLIACTLAALVIGPVAIAPEHLPAILGLPTGADPSDVERLAVLQIRLPRVCLALLVGAALGLAGAAMQGLMRNPLADPGLIGVSAGAAFAAAVLMVLGVDRLLPTAVALPAASFIGGAAAAAAVLRLSLVDGRTRIATMLLAGLALNAIAGAGIGFLAYLADDFALRTVTLWMFGSLGHAGFGELALALPLLLLPLMALPAQARALNALLLGEAEALHLGIDVEVLKRRVSVLIVLAVAVSVALAGIIGFIGLIVPHLVRLWTGPDHRYVLPGSALLGALLLLVADTAARTLFMPAELPIGILTALIGGPFFLALLLRYRDRPELA